MCLPLISRSLNCYQPHQREVEHVLISADFDSQFLRSRPLWSDDGGESDHSALVAEGNIAVKQHTYTKIYNRNVTANSEEAFCRRIQEHDLSCVVEEPNACMKAVFTNIFNSKGAEFSWP